MYTLRGVRKAYGSTRVLDGVDLDLPRGRSLALLGASGSGKSVLLKAMIGLVPVDAGTIAYEGRDVSRMDPEAVRKLRSHVGMVFQYNALFDSDSVAVNVAYGLHEHHGEMPAREVDERVAWALRSVGMGGTEDLAPAALSGGMRKRVGLARALAARPEVLLCDEPTMGLDPQNTTRVSLLLVSLQREMALTALIVTHDMHLAFSCDRVAMLNEGRILVCGTPDEVRAFDDPFLQDFILGRDHDEDF